MLNENKREEKSIKRTGQIDVARLSYPERGSSHEKFPDARAEMSAAMFMLAAPARPKNLSSQGPPKERRRRRAEKRLSKRVFLESPFLLCPLIRFSLTTPQKSREESRKSLLSGPISRDTAILSLRYSETGRIRFRRALGKRKHTPPCSSAELFFAEKNGVHRGKISVVDMVFLIFIGFLYPPPAWKVFLSGQKSSPKDFFSVVVVYAFFFSVSGHFRCCKSKP